jgi:hypothetical protein
MNSKESPISFCIGDKKPMPLKMALPVEKSMTCWICNRPANTREHIIKQSDIRRLFGRGPYQKGRRLKKTNQNTTKKLIQSEDSTQIKYQKSLCKNCNSSRSQPWDIAYDIFMEYILSHETELKKTRIICFEKMTEGNIGEFSKNLYPYFIKTFGCQIYEIGLNTPSELSNFLLGNRIKTNLKITFAIYENMPQYITSPMIQIHDFEGDFEILLKKPLNYTWAVSVEWLTIIFWYKKTPEPTLGSVFKGDISKIDIGSYKEIKTG